jgi:DNA repair exonuclease SbcCD ATPase subunit
VKLLRLTADGFGALRGTLAFDPARLTVVLDDNERGKTTMLEAVMAALYGLNGDRRSHRPLTPKERWRPWSGGTYRVELEVECDGRRLTVTRDFDRDTVKVVDERGREITSEFREGKDQFPVGRKLCGLDAAEFEMCALVRQGTLEAIVPADERERRASTMAARLETAAAVRVGDTNASEALQVLEAALRRYEAPELEFTGTVENAIQRLEVKLGLLEADLKSIEHDRSRLVPPLEELSRLAEEERTVRDELEGLEAERRSGRAAEARRRLDDDREHRAELQRLRGEFESLAAGRVFPANAEIQFQEAVARHEEASRNLASLEARRKEEIERERRSIERDLEPLAAWAERSEADADRCVALAAELRKLALEENQLHEDVFTLREALAGGTHDPDRMRWLARRFRALEDEEQRLLRGQSERVLDHQSEVAELERRRTRSDESLQAVDQRRARVRGPAWILVVAGFAALAVAGWMAMRPAAWPPLAAPLVMGAGLVAGLGGIALMRYGRRVAAQERDQALRDLTESHHRLNELKAQRAETELALDELARSQGYRDQIELLRDWSEYLRLTDESAPAVRAQEQLAAVERRRREALEDARGLLSKDGGAAVEPDELERAGEAIRRSAALRQRLEEQEQRWSWIDEERRVAAAATAGLHERALRILQGAGLVYDPERSWEDHARDLAERAKGRARLAVLREELIPMAEAQVLGEEDRSQLEAQAAAADPAPATETAPRSPDEIDAESNRCRKALDLNQRRRADLRVEIEEIRRRVTSQHPETLAQRDRMAQALARARRFHAAVELARDSIQTVATETHRRWADFLNRRVAELLVALGTGIEQVRFGDDLDFSVRVAGRPPLARAVADLQLSAGARDQLYLAIRIAVSEYLSRGRPPIPLLLDDVFASSDDERARAGAALLAAAVTTGHQVVMLTCHRGRYRSMLDSDAQGWGVGIDVVDASFEAVTPQPASDA